MIGYLYILKSSTSKKHYIGSTNDIERRIAEHKAGKSRYTKNSGPYELIYTQTFETLEKARKAEYWIKKQKDKELINTIIIEGLTKSF